MSDAMTTRIARATTRSRSLGPGRVRSLQVFLWVSVVSWGIGLGAKLFDLLVVAAAWGASPPESLSLMPYGRLYSMNPGDFFQPLSLLLLVGAVGALVAGWPAGRAGRGWLIVPVLMFAVIWILTPTVFWPIINDLWAVHRGKLSLSQAELGALVHRWFVWDWLRTALIAAGFLASLQAMRVAPGRGLLPDERQ